MADADLAARFFDEHKAPGLRRDGLSDDAIAGLRARYVVDACANHEAVRQLRELYPAEETSARLTELRAGAAIRAHTMPTFPDPPDEVAERAEEAPGWAKLQAETDAWRNDRG